MSLGPGQGYVRDLNLNIVIKKRNPQNSSEEQGYYLLINMQIPLCAMVSSLFKQLRACMYPRYQGGIECKIKTLKTTKSEDSSSVKVLRSQRG